MASYSKSIHASANIARKPDHQPCPQKAGHNQKESRRRNPGSCQVKLFFFHGKFWLARELRQGVFNALVRLADFRDKGVEVQDHGLEN